jgi:transcriptional regulator GlxA family with amidase domain
MNSTVIRTIASAQAVVGCALAVRPDAVSGMVGIRSPHAPPAWLVRVLGARMAAQAGLQMVAPSPDVVLLGAAVDATHAASMATVAALSKRYRRGAAVSGAIAGASALALLIARRAA